MLLNLDKSPSYPSWNQHESTIMTTKPKAIKLYMDVSENSGTPKSSILIGFSMVFHYKPSILGYLYFWKHPYVNDGFTKVMSRYMLHMLNKNYSRWLFHRFNPFEKNMLVKMEIFSPSRVRDEHIKLKTTTYKKPCDSKQNSQGIPNSHQFV